MRLPPQKSERPIYRLGGESRPAEAFWLIRPARHTAGELELPVVRLRSSAQNPAEPVFLLSGGPGTPNVYTPEMLAERGGGRLPFAWLLERHDLVMVGYRGAEGRPVLRCPGVEEFFTNAREPLRRESLVELARCWGRCRRRLEDAGHDPADFTIVDVVDDLEAARRRLGCERINLLGASYGSRLGWLYARRYPQNVRRMVLYGVNPPGRFVWEPAETDALLQRWAELWAADARARSRCAELIEAVTAVLKRLPLDWNGLYLDAGWTRVNLFHALFRVENAVRALDAFVDAANGDWAGLAALSRYRRPRQPAWGELAAKGLSADYDPDRDYLNELDPPGALLGSPLSLLYWAPVQLGGWQVETIDEDWRRHGPVEPPTLLVSGGLDPATPPAWAAELHPHLTAGQRVVVPYAAHCDDLERLQPEAFARLLGRFLAEGVVDESAFVRRPPSCTPEVKLGELLLR